MMNDEEKERWLSMLLDNRLKRNVTTKKKRLLSWKDSLYTLRLTWMRCR